MKLSDLENADNLVSRDHLEIAVGRIINRVDERANKLESQFHKELMTGAAASGSRDFVDVLIEYMGLTPDQGRKMVEGNPTAFILDECRKTLEAECPNRAAYLISRVKAGGWPEPKGHKAVSKEQKKWEKKQPRQAEVELQPSDEERGRVAAGLAAWRMEQRGSTPEQERTHANAINSL